MSDPKLRPMIDDLNFNYLSLVTYSARFSLPKALFLANRYVVIPMLVYVCLLLGSSEVTIQASC